MKTFVAALAAIVLLTAFTKPYNVQSPKGGAEALYETDGHYWTVYLVSTLLKIENARELAYYAELPDWDCDSTGCHRKANNTFLKGPWQGRVHALTGGDPAVERKASAEWVRKATIPELKGHALHRLGDSFAHTRKNGKKMFPHGIGHAFAGHKPDKIARDTAKYMTYVKTLIYALGGDSTKTDLSAFHYVCKQQLDSRANIEILKSEILLLNKQKTYYIHYKEVKATEDYLNYRKALYNFAYAIAPGSKKADAKVTITYN